MPDPVFSIPEDLLNAHRDLQGGYLTSVTNVVNSDAVQQDPARQQFILALLNAEPPIGVGMLEAMVRAAGNAPAPFDNAAAQQIINQRLSPDSDQARAVMNGFSPDMGRPTEIRSGFLYGKLEPTLSALESLYDQTLAADPFNGAVSNDPAAPNYYGNLADAVVRQHFNIPDGQPIEPGSQADIFRYDLLYAGQNAYDAVPSLTPFQQHMYDSLVARYGEDQIGAGGVLDSLLADIGMMTPENIQNYLNTRESISGWFGPERESELFADAAVYVLSNGSRDDVIAMVDQLVNDPVALGALAENPIFSFDGDLSALLRDDEAFLENDLAQMLRNMPTGARQELMAALDEVHDFPPEVQTLIVMANHEANVIAYVSQVNEDLANGPGDGNPTLSTIDASDGQVTLAEAMVLADGYNGPGLREFAAAGGQLTFDADGNLTGDAAKAAAYDQMMQLAQTLNATQINDLVEVLPPEARDALLGNEAFMTALNGRALTDAELPAIEASLGMDLSLPLTYAQVAALSDYADRMEDFQTGFDALTADEQVAAIMGLQNAANTGGVAVLGEDGTVTFEANSYGSYASPRAVDYLATLAGNMDATEMAALLQVMTPEQRDILLAEGSAFRNALPDGIEQEALALDQSMRGDIWLNTQFDALDGDDLAGRRQAAATILDLLGGTASNPDALPEDFRENPAAILPELVEMMQSNPGFANDFIDALDPTQRAAALDQLRAYCQAQTPPVDTAFIDQMEARADSLGVNALVAEFNAAIASQGDATILADTAGATLADRYVDTLTGLNPAAELSTGVTGQQFMTSFINDLMTGENEPTLQSFFGQLTQAQRDELLNDPEFRAAAEAAGYLDEMLAEDARLDLIANAQAAEYLLTTGHLPDGVSGIQIDTNGDGVLDTITNAAELIAFLDGPQGEALSRQLFAHLTPTDFLLIRDQISAEQWQALTTGGQTFAVLFATTEIPDTIEEILAGDGRVTQDGDSYVLDGETLDFGGVTADQYFQQHWDAIEGIEYALMNADPGSAAYQNAMTQLANNPEYALALAYSTTPEQFAVILNRMPDDVRQTVFVEESLYMQINASRNMGDSGMTYAEYLANVELVENVGVMGSIFPIEAGSAATSPVTVTIDGEEVTFANSAQLLTWLADPANAAYAEAVIGTLSNAQLDALAANLGANQFAVYFGENGSLRDYLSDTGEAFANTEISQNTRDAATIAIRDSIMGVNPPSNGFSLDAFDGDDQQLSFDEYLAMASSMGIDHAQALAGLDPAVVAAWAGADNRDELLGLFPEGTAFGDALRSEYNEADRNNAIDDLVGRVNADTGQGLTPALMKEALELAGYTVTYPPPNGWEISGAGDPAMLNEIIGRFDASAYERWDVTNVTYSGTSVAGQSGLNLLPNADQLPEGVTAWDGFVTTAGADITARAETIIHEQSVQAMLSVDLVSGQIPADVTAYMETHGEAVLQDLDVIGADGQVITGAFGAMSSGDRQTILVAVAASDDLADELPLLMQEHVAAELAEIAEIAEFADNLAQVLNTNQGINGYTREQAGDVILALINGGDLPAEVMAQLQSQFPRPPFADTDGDGVVDQLDPISPEILSGLLSNIAGDLTQDGAYSLMSGSGLDYQERSQILANANGAAFRDTLQTNGVLDDMLRGDMAAFTADLSTAVFFGGSEAGIFLDGTHEWPAGSGQMLNVKTMMEGLLTNPASFPPFLVERYSDFQGLAGFDDDRDGIPDTMQQDNDGDGLTDYAEQMLQGIFTHATNVERIEELLGMLSADQLELIFTEPCPIPGLQARLEGTIVGGQNLWDTALSMVDTHNQDAAAQRTNAERFEEINQNPSNAFETILGNPPSWENLEAFQKSLSDAGTIDGLSDAALMDIISGYRLQMYGEGVLLGQEWHDMQGVIDSLAAWSDLLEEAASRGLDEGELALSAGRIAEIGIDHLELILEGGEISDDERAAFDALLQISQVQQQLAAIGLGRFENGKFIIPDERAMIDRRSELEAISSSGYDAEAPGIVNNVLTGNASLVRDSIIEAAIGGSDQMRETGLITRIAGQLNAYNIHDFLGALDFDAHMVLMKSDAFVNALPDEALMGAINDLYAGAEGLLNRTDLQPYEMVGIVGAYAELIDEAGDRGWDVSGFPSLATTMENLTNSINQNASGYEDAYILLTQHDLYTGTQLLQNPDFVSNLSQESLQEIAAGFQNDIFAGQRGQLGADVFFDTLEAYDATLDQLGSAADAEQRAQCNELIADHLALLWDGQGFNGSFGLDANGNPIDLEYLMTHYPSFAERAAELGIVQGPDGQYVMQEVEGSLIDDEMRLNMMMQDGHLTEAELEAIGLDEGMRRALMDQLSLDGNLEADFIQGNISAQEVATQLLQYNVGFTGDVGNISAGVNMSGTRINTELGVAQ